MPAGRLRPDVGEESAGKTLRDAIYELRRVLGPVGRDAIVATRDQVGLDPALVRADLWEFRRHVAAGELEAAVEGLTGELLAGLDADWVPRAPPSPSRRRPRATSTPRSGGRAGAWRSSRSPRRRTGI